ncbi:unnamed protein product [Albugo candida]|uniref:DDE-1 domain-containing protein n=1 Tax=Albugo candida TaxID=65357 RepID=A0A024G4Z2_9STRA|nr:unnamed protein product [Albugo candida]|eukprot:CCI41894.1 unnamed protein product [Albugo candida]
MALRVQCGLHHQHSLSTCDHEHLTSSTAYGIGPGGKAAIAKKGQGRSLHVSDFLTDVCGRLALDEAKQLEYPDVPKESCVYMKPGKNNDGWWTAEHLHAQVRHKAIPIFNAQFLGSQALFAFDNATSHAAFAGDALVAKRMNLGPGGKQPKMRNELNKGSHYGHRH